jgi:vesicle-fusing ATPase
MPLTLQICSTPSNDLVHLNLIYVAPGTVGPSVRHLKLNDHVFNVSPHQDVAPGTVALNGIQRRSARVSTGDEVVVEPFQTPGKSFGMESVTIEVGLVLKKAISLNIDGERFAEVFRKRYLGQVFTVGQQWVMDFEGANYLLRAMEVVIIDEVAAKVEKTFMGLVVTDTNPVLRMAAGAAKNIKLSNLPASNMGRGADIFKEEFNMQNLGIGGLNEEFKQILRRAFASRIWPASVVKKMGINHVKGILLHGPPGTGKTLMARQIGKMLNCVEPKIVNGPEVFNKYVGQAEENIRNLFKDAEAEQKAKGDDSKLHLVIFDEFDAICKQRGFSRDSTGVHDGVVNQLLSKIDGVEQLNNILLVAMTNRLDMIDEAVLRPGRFEVQIKIGLPDEEGRLQIFQIKTRSQKENGFLDPDVDLAVLASRAKNFSGAEIEGLVASASSFAFNRQIDITNPTKKVDPDALRICMDDFEMALQEVKPAYGVQEEELEKWYRNGLFEYGPSWTQLMTTCQSFPHQLKTSTRTSSLSLLLEGPAGTGKTALAAYIARNSGFPFVKVINNVSMIGFSEIHKVNLIRKIFDDAYNSEVGAIVLDDIERLIEYVHMGPRFSNTILQALMVLIKAPPPPGKKLLIIGTTSSLVVLESMDLLRLFNANITVPPLSKSAGDVTRVLPLLEVEFKSDIDKQMSMSVIPQTIGIKPLILMIGIAQALVTQSAPEGTPALVTSEAISEALRYIGAGIGEE